MLTPEQSRAARGWLDWTQQALAERAHVSLTTVRDFEKGRRAPIANNLAAMKQAIDAAGIQLVFRKGKPAGIAIVDDPADSPDATAAGGGGSVPDEFEGAEADTIVGVVREHAGHSIRGVDPSGLPCEHQLSR